MALTELASSCGLEHWVRKSNWLSASHHICDWELVGCDHSGRVKVLALDFNNLTGVLPTSLGLSLPKLQDLDLEHNRLEGTVPSSLGNLTSLVQLGLGGNLFSGKLPSAICPTLARIVGKRRSNAGAPPPCDLSGSGFACPLPCPELTSACGAVCGGNSSSHWQSINAITLSTRDMQASTAFYQSLGLYVTLAVRIQFDDAEQRQHYRQP